MKRFFYLLIIIYSTADAQGLKIGDRVPDVYLHSIMNASRTSGKLSEFRKKLTILDFWGPGCSACIAAFPHMDTLQKQFKDDIQILMVNSQSTDSIKRFLRLRKKIKLADVPYVTGDTTLTRLFPHVYMPHHVWIDNAGIVQYITAGANATAEHVAAFLAGKGPVIAEKKYFAKSYEEDILTFTRNHAEVPIVAYSMLTHVLSDVQLLGSTSTREGGPRNMISITGPILLLYEVAYGEYFKHPFPADLLEVRRPDSLKYLSPKDGNKFDKWSEENLFNYELRVPEADAPRIFEIMKQDLERYFGMKGHIEIQPRDCYMLIEVDSSKIPRSTKQKIKTNLWRVNEDSVKFAEGVPFETFGQVASAFVKSSTKLQFKDATTFKGKVDFHFPGKLWDFYDLEGFISSLHTYGLDLVKTRMPCEVLVIE